MQVRLLDEIAVASSRDDAPLGSRRARLVLVALALDPGSVPAERLADVVWGPGPPPTWRTALRGLVAQLRRAAPGGDALVVTTSTGYRIGPAVRTDLDEVRDAAEEAERLLEQDRAQAVVDRLAPSLGLRGDRLAPGLDDDWLAPHRAAVDELSLRIAELVVSAAGRTGDHALAVRVGRDVVAAQPLVERSHRTLLRALGGAADRGAAAVAFDACRTVLAEELGVDPSDETVATYRDALGAPARATGAAIPTTPTTFVGRDDEVRRLRDALGSPGLVTLTGRGGVGKSRLAAEVARAAPGFDGRQWTSLGTVEDDPLVASTVTLQLGLATASEDPTGEVVRHLAALGRVLLVLDGCDSVVDGAATLATTLREALPQLTVLVTSRRRLGLDGERLLELSEFPDPDTDDLEALARSWPVRLIRDRVRERGGELSVSRRHAGDLAALCRRCAGLPLALELVAAQLATLPPGDLVDLLEEAGPHGDDALRRVAEASYALLDADEAAVFRRLAVVDGPVSLMLVRALVVTEQVPALRVVRILRELDARGMVGVRRGGPRLRYEQEDDLKRLATSLLRAAGEETDAFGRLADAIVDLLPTDPRAAPAPFQEAVTDLLPSVRSLLGAGIDGRFDRDRCLEVAFRLHRYWATTNVGEGRFWLGRLLADDAAADARWTPYARFALGYLGYWAADTGTAVIELEQAVAALRGTDDSYAARAMHFLAGTLDDLDRSAEALARMREALITADAAADAETAQGMDLRVGVEMDLGSLLAERGDREAVRHVADAIERCESGASADHLTVCLPHAAMICWQVGALLECRAYLDRSWPMLADSRRIARVDLLTTASALALDQGDLDAAVDHGRSADRLAADLGMDRNLPLIHSLLALALLDRGDVDEAAQQVSEAVERGRALGAQHPLALALEVAALVAERLGAPASDLARLLEAASGIRLRGLRPVPVPLAPTVEALLGRVGSTTALVGLEGLDTRVSEAAELAKRLLAAAPERAG